MRYDKSHKANTRKRLLEVASKEFREGGIDGVGLAGLMKSASLTNGAFYAHFDSKEELVREVVETTFESQLAIFSDAFAKGATIRDVIREYLSPARRDDCGSGCIVAALAAEVARHPKSTRKVFSAKVDEMIDLLSEHIEGKSLKEKRSKATAVYAQMFGTLQLSRVVTDPVSSNAILESGMKAAFRIINISD